MPARSVSTRSSPSVGARRPAQSRSSVVFPEPFAPGDDEEAAVLEVEVELLQDAFLPEAA